jgi:lycopene cyclase domain-containing protein
VTYFRFHLWFNFPLLGLLAWWNSRFPWIQGEAAAMGWVLLAVMIFTSPWDNAAAKAGIWGFPREKFSLQIGYLPVEEYLFFILQSLNVMLALRGVLWSIPAALEGPVWQLGMREVTQAGGLILLWGGVGVFFRNQPRPRRTNYLVHLFFWFLPVLGLQWTLAGELLSWHGGRLLLLTLLFGTYYVVADILAVRAKVWHFDETQIQGWKLQGILPWEEIAFFYLTSLLVAQSYLLLAPEAAR